MSKYYYCIDVGGTDIKAGIVDSENNIIARSKTANNDCGNFDLSTFLK